MSQSDEVLESSGNVFADLELDEPEEMLANHSENGWPLFL